MSEHFYSVALSRDALTLLDSELNPTGSELADRYVRNCSNQNLRTTYQQIFDEQTKSHSLDPNWWKLPFTLCANKFADHLKQELMKEPNQGKQDDDQQDDNIKIAKVGGLIQTFDSARQATLFIGRHPGCDLVLTEFPHDRNCSRLHCVFYPLRSLNSILIVDVGSASGIYTLKRSNKHKDLVSSTPTHRRVLLFDWNEFAIVQLGDRKLILNPRDCVVCMERGREVTLKECQHCCCCSSCLVNLSECPICRVAINEAASSDIHCKTFVQST